MVRAAQNVLLVCAAISVAAVALQLWHAAWASAGMNAYAITAAQRFEATADPATWRTFYPESPFPNEATLQHEQHMYFGRRFQYVALISTARLLVGAGGCLLGAIALRRAQRANSAQGSSG